MPPIHDLGLGMAEPPALWKGELEGQEPVEELQPGGRTATPHSHCCPILVLLWRAQVLTHAPALPRLLLDSQRKGRVPQPQGQWGALQALGIAVSGTAGAVGGQGSGGQLCEGPREPATP